MTLDMKRAAFAVIALFVTGCPSKDSTSSSGATSPSGSSGNTTAATSGAGGGGGTGPLANLESAPFANEVWTSQEGAQLPIIFYTQQNVRLSSTCRNGAGQLGCDAVKQLRGKPVDVPKRELTGNTSAGTRVCVKLKNTLVNAHNASGNEDGFCRFPDGSLVSTGALEQYVMHVLE
jgi:hypothetical protein